MKHIFNFLIRKFIREKHLGYKVRYEIFGLHFDVSPYEYLKKEVKHIVSDLGQYKKIVILFNHTGETSFILSGIFQHLNRNELNDILFIGTIAYHKDLVNLYCPTKNYIFRPNLNWVHLRWGVREVNLDINGVNVVLTPVFNYFAKYEEAVRNEFEFAHFYRNLFDNHKFLEPKYIKPFTNKKQVIWVNAKLRAASVNSKYVLVCNESASNINFPWQFWFELTHKLRLLGFEVVFNTFTNSPASSVGKSFFTTLGEGIELARNAECLIGLRSGFLDLALPVAKQMIVLYTPFRERARALPRMPAEKVQKAFTLTNIPCKHKCKIDEYIFEEPKNVSFSKLIDMVVSALPPPIVDLIKKLFIRFVSHSFNLKNLYQNLELS